MGLVSANFIINGCQLPLCSLIPTGAVFQSGPEGFLRPTLATHTHLKVTSGSSQLSGCCHLVSWMTWDPRRQCSNLMWFHWRAGRRTPWDIPCPMRHPVHHSAPECQDKHFGNPWFNGVVEDSKGWKPSSCVTNDFVYSRQEAPRIWLLFTGSNVLWKQSAAAHGIVKKLSKASSSWPDKVGEVIALTVKSMAFLLGLWDLKPLPLVLLQS